MKEIMATKSSTEESIPTYEFHPSKHKFQVGNLFANTSGKLISLGKELSENYKGEKLTVSEIYHDHNVGTPYILSNYKKALLILEAENMITVDKPATVRPKRKGELTLGEDRLITFK